MTVEALVQNNLKLIDAARAPRSLLASVKTITETAGLRTMLLDMGVALNPDLSFGLDCDGYAVTVQKGGSDRTAVLLDLGEAGIYGPVYPGMTIRPQQKFRRIRVRRWMSSVLPLGTALTDAGCSTIGRYLTLVVAKTPAAVFDDGGGDVDAGFVHTRSLSGQAYNSVANVPTSVNDGMKLRGTRAFKVLVASATNILGGTIVWWIDPGGTGAQWAETEVQQQLVVNGRLRCVTPELETPFQGAALAFPELRSFTNVGAAAPTLTMYTYGEGGEMNAGDIQP